MVHIITGLQGSGKTKKLIDAINHTLNNETGSVVCIEKGHTMRFDLSHKVRLVDASEYAIGSYPFLKGFLSGLHAGNFDIAHVFIDNLCRIAHSDSEAETEAFLNWCDQFSAANGVSFTFTISCDEENVPGYIAKFM
ncbi:MAG: hypothetical protein IIV87_02200 [Oscillospiraceae bacterium]|jgi:hypothetical protein|nr:hypothetical protein [Oscillospiraceae bacterium]MBQ5748948.1 hypothetical protein [Oscillospiraceae bacterium]